MGDMGEIFRDWNAHKKERKKERLAAANPEGWTIHTEYHWSRDLNGSRLDYWPSTGKFRYKGKTMFGGITGFIKKREKKNDI